MTKKDFRRRRSANHMAKTIKINGKKMSVSQAFTVLEASEKIMTALGPLPLNRKLRILKAVAILHNININVPLID